MMVEWVAFLCGGFVGSVAGAVFVGLVVVFRNDGAAGACHWPDDPMFHRGRPRMPR